MKTLIAIFATIMTFANFSLAHVSVEDSSQNLIGNLVDFEINQEWLDATNDGSILINLDENMIQLVLREVVECRAGMACIALAPTIVDNIEVKLVSQTVDSCGAVTYIGEKDQTPVDGLKQTVTVVDNRYMTCEIPVLHMTSVTYTTFNPWTQDTLKSYMGGGGLFLQPIFFGGIKPPQAHPTAN